MTLNSFGACSQLPLADCPFSRSPLTVADAAEELRIVQSRTAYSVCEEIPDAAPTIDYGPRMRTMDIEQCIREIETAVPAPTQAPELSGPFWVRLAWLRQGAGY